MSAITVILEPDADGTLHMPLPAELKDSKVKVTATIPPAPEETAQPTREEALAALRMLQGT